jgi:hypothetical protein
MGGVPARAATASLAAVALLVAAGWVAGPARRSSSPGGQPPAFAAAAAGAEPEQPRPAGPPDRAPAKQPREPIKRTAGPAEAVKIVYEDARKIAAADEARQASAATAEPDAPYQRYLWLSGRDEWLEDDLVALSLHLNLLSDQGVTTHPTLIAPDVVRIDVRAYGFDANNKLAVYDRTAEKDVVFHQRAKVLKDGPVPQHWPGGRGPTNTKDYERGVWQIERKAGDVIDEPASWLPREPIDALRKLLVTESPILPAEWFLVQSARQTSLTNDEAPGIGYYDFTGLKSRDDFFKQTGTDPKVARKVFADWRAVVLRSGISRQNRLVVALGSHTRRAWGTLDTFAQVGRGVARRNLRDGEFLHNAEEWFGFRGNGLPLVFLSDAAGVAAPSAPDKIGPDDSALNRSRDYRVHVGISCWRCHANDKDLLKPVTDWARRTFRQGGPLKLADPDRKVQQELESLYLRDLDALLDDDRALYVRGVAAATRSAKNPKGLSPAAAFRTYCETYTRYADTDLTLEDAARELGCAPKSLTDGIKAHASAPNRGLTDNVLVGFLDDPPSTIDRLDWEDSYALAAALAAGIQPPERVEKQKVKPALDGAGKSDTTKAGGKSR